MFYIKSFSWLLLVAASCYLIPAGYSEIWRSGGMARSACKQREEFNKTGVIPQPIKDQGNTKLCGWFSKGIEGDACADIRYFWLGCKIPNGTSRIIGGKEARRNKFPSSARIGEQEQACGGSIINEEWVLTAAHCIAGKTFKYYIHAGDHNGTQADINDPGEQMARAVQYFIHPNYDPKIVLNDLGLIKFAPKLNWTNTVEPVRLPEENFIHTKGIIGVTIGWGTGSDEILHETELAVITTERCREIFDAHVEKEDNVTITDDYISGQYPEGDVRNVCYGDSGSPFYACEDNKLVQIGVTDFTGGCNTHYPVGYMRVSKYLTWINETIAKNSS